MIRQAQKWLCYTFPFGNFETEILLARLADLPCLGFEELNDRVVCYFHPQDKQFATDCIKEMEQEFPAIEHTVSYIENQDWHLSWQQYFQPVQITPSIAVYPHWQSYEGAEAVTIAIVPGAAFGTGTHATTQLALKMLERHIRPDMTVLDAGCGSGILSVAALKLGARHVDAWDIDPDITDNFHEHMELNKTPARFTLNIGDVTRLKRYHYDLVLSNIERKPNLNLLDSMSRCGKIPPSIFTGILKDEYAMFKRNVLNYGLIFTEEMFQDEWAVLVTN